MYRNSDIKTFWAISFFANIALIAALFLIGVFHFLDPQLVYRDFALLALLISLFLQFQLALIKVEIFEKRIARLTQPGREMSSGTGNLLLIFYFSIFWLVLIFMAIAYFPALSELFVSLIRKSSMPA